MKPNSACHAEGPGLDIEYEMLQEKCEKLQRTLNAEMESNKRLCEVELSLSTKNALLLAVAKAVEKELEYPQGGGAEATVAALKAAKDGGAMEDK